MKKFLIGFIAGAVLMVSGQLYAAAPFVGKKVESMVAVKLNEKSIGDGIVVDGTTFLPVRTIAGALNLNTNYVNGVVSVSGAGNTENPASVQQAQVEAQTNQFNQLNAAYNDLLSKMSALQTTSKGYEEKLIPDWEAKVAAQPQNPVNTSTLARYKDQLKQQKADLAEAQIKLQASKADLDAFVKDHPEFEKFITKK
ncbi:hypothetical protein [Paenibacillus humicus]|uniref:hypothetical protein n=1 Tax=Paenibacillus humicus TaxID=412861 RepID=UPI003F181481